MARHRANPPAAPGRRTRGGAPADEPRARPRRRADAASELSDDELRTLADADVDPDEAARVAREAVVAEQEASDHDRDTPRDRLEGLHYPDED